MSKGHDLDYSEIDELDERADDEQLVLIWCDTHNKYEWHWIDRSLIGTPKAKRQAQQPARRRQ